MSLPTDNAYHDIKLSEMKIKIYDCGNIKCENREITNLHASIQKVILQITSSIKNSIVFIIGGTDDLLYPVLKATSESLKDLNLVRIDSAFDMKGKHLKRFDELVVYYEHHLSHFRMILEDEGIVKSLKQTTFFAL